MNSYHIWPDKSQDQGLEQSRTGEVYYTSNDYNSIETHTVQTDSNKMLKIPVNIYTTQHIIPKKKKSSTNFVILFLIRLQLRYLN